MRNSTPLDKLLQEIELAAERAGGLPWEHELSIDFLAATAQRVVTCYKPGTHECTPVAGQDVELTEEVQKFIATLNPAVALLLVREMRRLLRVEERYEIVNSHMVHVEAFLTRRGLQRQALRFAAVQEQLGELGHSGT
jgi:SpoU rRNA methylase family enzyme